MITQVPLFISLILFAVVAVLLLTGHPGQAIRITNWAFVIATVAIFIKFFRKRK